MASHRLVDMTTSSQGQATSQEGEIGRRGFEIRSPGESSHMQAEDDSKEVQHKAAAPEEQGVSSVESGMAKLLSYVNQEMLQEIIDWPRRSRLEQKRTKSGSLSRTCCERPNFKPEWQEIDDTVKSIRRILNNPVYDDDARLSSEDELAVRKLLKFHPRSKEKIGCGVDFIKINRHCYYKDVRCFWVVRKDGTEADFSYHKCLKEKVAKEVPDLLDHYEALYQTRRA